jgi:hypothetical protein
MMKDLLFNNDMYDPIEDMTAKPKETFHYDRKTMNRKDVSMIRHRLDVSVYQYVEAEMDAHKSIHNGGCFTYLVPELISTPIVERKCLMLIEKGGYISTLSLFNFCGPYLINCTQNNKLC